MGSDVLFGSMMGYLWLYGRYSALAILPPARMTFCESKKGHNFASLVSLIFMSWIVLGEKIPNLINLVVSFSNSSF